MKKKISKREFIRFHPLRRIEHLLIIIGFFMLVLTGLPQRFHDQNWATYLVDLMGGISSMRSLHRFFGILFTTQFVLHISYSLWTILIRRQPPTMAPTKKDVRDAILSFKYCLRLTNNHPRFGRYDYRQKFEYWGVMVGGALMISTGLILWKPIFFATFLPAELIPICRVAHSSEALLAFMVIVFWHLYSVIFSPEVFPLDTAMFTGRISEERMKREHPLEYEALKKNQEKAKSNQN